MLQLSEIKNLPVYTKSGKHLGRVTDVEIDSLSQLILRYQVSHWPKIPGLWKGRLLIAREQVISISKSAMIVEDSLSPDSASRVEATPVAG
ncbi:MAG: PRC-barrel domain-containing protein [Patescibacteria group bacterium]